MYRFWGAIIEPALNYLQPKTIVEVGAGKGHHTKYLLKFAKDHGGHLHVVDPKPKYSFERWQAQEAMHFTGHLKSSLSALLLIERPDLVLIDGDHNWYTVYNELKLLDEQGKKLNHYPVIFIHDIDWPYGRRDLYHDPEAIPKEFRQPYNLDPISLDDSGSTELTMSAAHAASEGGPKNGVRTAVEDWLPLSFGNYTFVELAGFHGLGILVEQSTIAGNADFATWLHCLRTSQAAGSYVQKLEQERLTLALMNSSHNQSKQAKVSEQSTLQDSLDQLQAECNTQNRTIETMQQELNSTEQERDLLMQHGSQIHRSLWWRVKAPVRVLGKFLSYLGSLFKSHPKTESLKISFIISCNELDKSALKNSLESITTQSSKAWEVIISLKSDETTGVDVVATDYQLRFGENIALDKHPAQADDDQVFVSSVAKCTGDYVVLMPAGNSLAFAGLQQLIDDIKKAEQPKKHQYKLACVRHDVISRFKSADEIESLG